MNMVRVLFTTTVLAGCCWIFAAARKRQEPANRPALDVPLPALFHGNPGSRVFHLPACKYSNAKGCVEIFASREEAVGADFKPCSLCAP
ncbi:MAG: hypothetical protein WDA20_12995 [Desulfuromonadales bacterium]|jgi:hypothetical protein